jgi:hypothetical protein
MPLALNMFNEHKFQIPNFEINYTELRDSKTSIIQMLYPDKIVDQASGLMQLR